MSRPTAHSSYDYCCIGLNIQEASHINSIFGHADVIVMCGLNSIFGHVRVSDVIVMCAWAYRFAQVTDTLTHGNFDTVNML